MLTILPSTVFTKVAQPTEQYGQMLGVVFAPLMRSSWARATVGLRFTPEPIRPLSAVPVPAATPRRRKSRREISITDSFVRGGYLSERKGFPRNIAFQKRGVNQFCSRARS